MDPESVPLLLISANVGSLFEDVSKAPLFVYMYLTKKVKERGFGTQMISRSSAPPSLLAYIRLRVVDVCSQPLVLTQLLIVRVRLMKERIHDSFGGWWYLNVELSRLVENGICVKAHAG